MNRQPVVLRMMSIASVLVAGCILWSLYPWVPIANFDFNLYYLGGLIERTGSYTDTTAILAAARHAQLDVSTDGVYGSPTLVALIFQPLSLFSLSTAHVIWHITTFGFFVLAIRRAVGTAWWPLWLCLAVLSYSNIEAIALGNFAVVTTALLLWSYGSIRTKNYNSAGIALAIATACKLYPAVLLLPLIFRKEWPLVRWTLGTLGILLAATPFALGWHDSMDAIRQTLHVASYVNPWIENNGLPAVVARATHNQTLAQWTARSCLGVTIAAVFLLRKSCTTPVLLAITALLMTLAQGISWHMYYGISLMALLAGRDMTMNRISWTALGVGYFLTNSVVGFSTKLFPGDDTGIPATCGLILMAATLLTQVRIRPVDENVGPPANAAS